MSRELDAKVAEKVLGFQVQKERDTAFIQERYRYTYWCDPPRGIYPQQVGRDGAPGWVDIDEYTSNPSADYEVLKHVREKWPKNEMEIDRFDKFLSALAQMWDERCRSFECGLSYGSGYGHGAKLGRMYEPGDYSKAALNALGVNTTMTKPSDSDPNEGTSQVNQ